jgi:hypothetical protein
VGIADRVLVGSTIIMVGSPRLWLRDLLFAPSPRGLLMLRGRGESRSTRVCATGAGLALATGMRDTTGLGRLRLYMLRSTLGSSRNLSSYSSES